METGKVLALVLSATAVYAQETKGVVMVGTSQPLVNAVVKVEAPGRSLESKTDASGNFKVSGLKGDKALVSVLQGGQLVYRAIRDVKPGEALQVHLAAAIAAPAGFDPVALGVLPGGEVYVANGKDNGVYRLQGGKLDAVGKPGSLEGAGQEINDLAALMKGPERQIFTCVGAKRLIQSNGAGRVVTGWQAPGADAAQERCISLALDPHSGAVFVGNDAESKIYQLVGGKALRLFAEVFANELGPMAVDGVANTLYVGDAKSGTVIAVDLNTRRSKNYIKGLGVIRALAVDELRRRLYVGAPGKSRIVVFDLTQKAAAGKDFVGAQVVKSVYALGVDPSDGSVYVGDRDSHSLFTFSADGELMSKATGK